MFPEILPEDPQADLLRALEHIAKDLKRLVDLYEAETKRARGF